ncbi:MAG: Holliday junction branch migration protein RuvA [Bacilli bacterium]
MFDYIKGLITNVTAEAVTIENNNIGYTFKTANPYLFTENSETIVYLHQYVREDNISLYGFSSREERAFFNKLISVKGIGPKSALAILATSELDELKTAIEEGNIEYLQQFPGIGLKASQQIVLDLRKKLDFKKEIIKNPKVDEVLQALKNLGYKSKELDGLQSILISNINLPIQDLLKLCLQKLSNKSVQP